MKKKDLKRGMIIGYNSHVLLYEYVLNSREFLEETISESKPSRVNIRQIDLDWYEFITDIFI